MLGLKNLTSDRKLILLFPSALFLLLLSFSFFPSDVGRYSAAGVMLVGLFLSFVFLRKKAEPSVTRKDVILIMSVAALLLVIIYYLSGLYFGFYHNPYGFSFVVFYKHIAPIALIIVSTEIIRNKVRRL